MTWLLDPTSGVLQSVFSATREGSRFVPTLHSNSRLTIRRHPPIDFSSGFDHLAMRRLSDPTNETVNGETGGV